MKFFRSFQILHRRTKSATFESGPAGTGVQLNLIPPLKRSSLPSGLDSSGETPSIFGLVTFNEVPAPTAFSHLRSPKNATSTGQQTSSRASIEVQKLALEENARLREALDMWYQEYTRVENLLQLHRSELTLVRQSKEVLELQSARDQEYITDLKEELSRREVRLAKSDELIRSTTCSRCSQKLPDNSSKILRPRITSRATVTTQVSRTMKSRTLDDYQSALRATLSVRSQLRDHKKKVKFWKNKALGTGRCEGVVTPSSSAISSLNEPLNEKRKAAVENLMRERGIVLPSTELAPSSPREVSTSPLRIIKEPLLGQSISSRVQERDQIVPPQYSALVDPAALSTSLTLTSAPSESSAISSSSCRLAPLASDSLKAEINMFFGINESTSRWFSSSKPRGLSSSASGSSSVLASSSPKPISKPMLNTSRLPRVDVDNLTLPIQPYDDLSWIFRSPMSQANDNNAPAGKGSRCLPTPGSPWQVLDLSGSTLANSSFPSGSSGALLEAFSNLKDLKPLETSTPPSWRWHKHLAKRQHSKNNNSGEPRSAHTTVTDAKAVDDGRKSVLGMKRPFSRLKKHSGLPVLPPGEP